MDLIRQILSVNKIQVQILIIKVSNGLFFLKQFLIDLLQKIIHLMTSNIIYSNSRQ
jgi:hypothetical protein